MPEPFWRFLEKFLCYVPACAYTEETYHPSRASALETSKGICICVWGLAIGLGLYFQKERTREAMGHGTGCCPTPNPAQHSPQAWTCPPQLAGCFCTAPQRTWTNSSMLRLWSTVMPGSHTCRSAHPKTHLFWNIFQLICAETPSGIREQRNAANAPSAKAGMLSHLSPLPT